MESNPYTSPSTPSNEMLTHMKFSELDGTTAYREGDLFYCKPDFTSPPICFITGSTEVSHIEKTALFVGSTSIALYLTQQRRNKINWESIPLGQILSVIVIMILLLTMYTSLVPILILTLPFIIYGFRIPKNCGIKTTYLNAGYIQIKDAHPDFLRHFPDHKKLPR